MTYTNIKKCVRSLCFTCKALSNRIIDFLAPLISVMWLSSGQWASSADHDIFQVDFHSLSFFPGHSAKNEGFQGSEICNHRREGTGTPESFFGGEVY